jgi:hypothetical protein
MSSTSVVILVVVIVVILAIVAALVMLSRRRALQKRFGPEYDRAVAEGDSRLAAERELRERERRHAQLQLRELSPESRERYTAAWDQIQAKFLDDPNGAVDEADKLVTQLIAERGYPTGDYDEQVANLSVEHARTLGHYRDAHEINLANAKGEATTEQLRQAVVHYRELFSDLLGTPRDATTAPSTTATTTATETVTDRTSQPAGYDADRSEAADRADRAESDRYDADDDADRVHRTDRTDREEAERYAAGERVEHDTTNRS